MMSMDDFLEFFIYVDDDLVKSLFGTMISGFIDVRTVKLIQDRTISGKLQEGGSNGFSGEARDAKEERDGYKTKNCVDVDNSRFDKNWLNSFDASQYNRIENSITQIYGTLSFHNDLYQNLLSSNKITSLDNLSTSFANLSSGDYVNISGTILTNSYTSYLDKILNIIDSYTPELLNTLITDTNNLLNFTIIYKLLFHLKERLSENSTQDLILETLDKDQVIITVKNDCFLNGTCHPFDKVNCKCSVFGKILNINAVEDIGLSLFRKTCCEDYYENLLDDCEPYWDILRKNGVRVPCKPDYRITGNTLVIVPVSIYH